MRQVLTEAGFANIFANFLGEGLERLVDPDDDPTVYSISDLPLALMDASCNNLRIRSGFEGAYVVSSTPSEARHITPDALLERLDDDAHMVVFLPEECLRDGTIPLREFLPVDTFRNLEIMEQQVIHRINKVPVYKRMATLWNQHAVVHIPIIKRLEYLINLISLCVEHEEMGKFFHLIDLIPDRNPEVTDNFSDRVARNQLALTVLCSEQLSVADRVDALQLDNPALVTKLVAVLDGIEGMNPADLTRAIFEAERENGETCLSFDNWRFVGEPGWH